MSTSISKSKPTVVVLPAGVYDAVVIAACPGKHRQGHTTVRLDLEILGPTHVGEIVQKWYNLTSPGAVQFLRQEFSTMGQTINQEQDLPQACKDIVGLTVKLSVVEDSNGAQKKLISDLSSAEPVRKESVDIWS